MEYSAGNVQLDLHLLLYAVDNCDRMPGASSLNTCQRKNTRWWSNGVGNGVDNGVDNGVGNG